MIKSLYLVYYCYDTFYIEVNPLKKSNIVLSVGIGFLVGYVFLHQQEQNNMLTPERALQFAKEKFAEAAPIVGSWIYVKQERLEMNGLLYDTYRGGITRNIDGKNEQIEFFVDKMTGAIIYAGPMD